MKKSIRTLLFAAATTWSASSVATIALLPAPANAQAPAAAPPAAAQPGQQANTVWLTDLNQAQQLAVQTRRPLLLHFWSNDCPPCMALERNVLHRPDVERALAAGFVPVKVKVEDHPDIVRQLRVDRMPVDVVLSPEGQELYRGVSEPDAVRYLSSLSRVAAAPIAAGTPSPTEWMKNNAVAAASATKWNSFPQNGAVAQAGAVGAPGAMPAGVAAEAARLNNAAASANQQVQRAAGMATSAANNAAANVAAANAAVASAELPAIVLPPECPPLALDGFCAVTLAEQKKWKRADKRWGVIHRERTYLFSGPAEQQKFLANPDRYSPMLSGYDPVRFLDQQQLVAGRRQHGLWYHDQMFLFTDEATLKQFSANPEQYVPRVEQAMRGTATGGLSAVR